MADTDGGFSWSDFGEKLLDGAIDVAKAKYVDVEQYDRQMYGFEDQYLGYNGTGGAYGVAGNPYPYAPRTPGAPLNMQTVLLFAVLGVSAVFVVKKAL